MATGLHGVRLSLAREGGTVVVIGDGAVGLCAVLGASSVVGAERVVLLSTHEDRAALGRRFGATDVVAARGEEAKEAVLDLTGGLGAESVVEAVGTPSAWTTAFDVVRDGGMVGSVGVPHTTPTVELKPLFLRNVGVRGGLCPVRAYLPDLLARVLDGSLAPGAVFDTTLPLEQAPEAYRLMDERRSIKVALVP
jgi:threonine dehydrogenase-like Zn-dependent dehydrogenase